MNVLYSYMYNVYDIVVVIIHLVSHTFKADFMIYMYAYVFYIFFLHYVVIRVCFFVLLHISISGFSV